MKKFFWHLWQQFYNDEMFFRRCLRGFLFWLSTIAIQIIPNLEEATGWSKRDWVIRLIVSGIAGFAGMINLGHPNPKEKNNADPPTA